MSRDRAGRSSAAADATDQRGAEVDATCVSRTQASLSFSYSLHGCYRALKTGSLIKQAFPQASSFSSKCSFKHCLCQSVDCLFSKFCRKSIRRSGCLFEWCVSCAPSVAHCMDCWAVGRFRALARTKISQQPLDEFLLDFYRYHLPWWWILMTLLTFWLSF